jgi:hypothetical protein
LTGTDENLPIAFLKLSDRVTKKTKGAQLPWVSASIFRAIDWSIQK